MWCYNWGLCWVCTGRMWQWNLVLLQREGTIWQNYSQRISGVRWQLSQKSGQSCLSIVIMCSVHQTLSIWMSIERLKINSCNNLSEINVNFQFQHIVFHSVLQSKNHPLQMLRISQDYFGVSELNACVTPWNIVNHSFEILLFHILIRDVIYLKIPVSVICRMCINEWMVKLEQLKFVVWVQYMFRITYFWYIKAEVYLATDWSIWVVQVGLRIYLSRLIVTSTPKWEIILRTIRIMSCLFQWI